MPFQPGQSGNLAGRPKGESTRFRFDVAQILKDRDYSPFETLINLAINGKNDYVKLNAASELAAYVAPRLKAVEISTDTENPFSITLNLGGNK